MHTRHYEVEGNYRKLCQQALNEGLPPVPLRRRPCAVKAVQQLRGGNSRDSDIVFGITRRDFVKIKLASLGGDQHARIDQRCHADFATTGCVVVKSSTTARYSLSGLGSERKRSTSCAPLNFG